MVVEPSIALEGCLSCEQEAQSDHFGCSILSRLILDFGECGKERG
jgi:hypothetical protein